jgi:acetolactate synthase-1/2/3 large subunit
VNDIAHLAQELVRLGTRCTFGIPGEGPSLELLTELQRFGCPFHLVSHEAAGALMAGGFGRVTGIPGVCLSIKGPGFSNMLTGIASNWLDRNPVLSLSESYGPGSSPDRMHKRMAHAAMIKPVTKAYADNPSPDLLPRLWNLCLAEEPGPVHLDISARMEQTDIESSALEAACSQALPLDIVRRLQHTRKPVVLAGALASRRSWGSKLSALNIPVFTTVAGKGVLDETLPSAVGVFTNSGGPYAPESRLLPKADLIVGLGLRTTELIDIKPLPVPLIALDELPGRVNGLGAVAEAPVNADAFLETLDFLASKEWGSAEVAETKATLGKRLALHGWLPAAAFRVVQDVLPTTTRFFLDTGNFCTIGEHTLIAYHPHQIMGSALGRSMGVALPTSVGAALALPSISVVVAVGDGGIRMYPDVITIAVRKKLPLLVLLMTDGFFSSVRQGAVKKGLAQQPLRLESSYWADVFRIFGCPAERIASCVALESALRAWDRSTGPLFLELAFDADAYLSMTEGIR